MMPALLRAAVLALLALPARAQDAHAPCLEPRPDLQAYVAAFEAEGWTLATGKARDDALPGPAQSEVFRQVYAQVIDDLPPLDDLAAFEAQALALAAERLAEATLLTRGDAALALRLQPSDEGGLSLACALAAPDLPEADALLADGPDPRRDLRDDVHVAVRESDPPPPGLDALIVVAYAVVQPLPRPLAGAESVLVLARLGAPS
jgi:hypothetical protein